MGRGKTWKCGYGVEVVVAWGSALLDVHEGSGEHECSARAGTGLEYEACSV